MATTSPESARLDRLRLLAVMDTQPEPIFDGLVRVAAAICGTPISLVSLVDDRRQWFKANVGLDGVSETDRGVAFCAHAIENSGVMEVSDAQVDARFARNPLVLGDPNIRFYAGAPITMPGGERIGTLCVIDREPRRLTDDQKRALADLAAVAQAALLQREQQHYQQSISGESRFRALSDITPMGIFQANEHGDYFYTNRYWQSLWGMGLERSMGRGWTEALHPEDRDAVLAAWRQATASGQQFDQEYRLLRGGEVIYLRSRASPAQWGEPLQRGWVGITADISARRKAELALLEANRFLQRAENIGGVGAWDIDLQSGAVRWSDQNRRIYDLPQGYQPGSDDHLKYFDADAQRLIAEKGREAIKTGQPWDLELPMTTATGRSIWVRSVGQAEYGDKGAVRLVGTLQDITVQKTAQDELRAANALLENVLSSLPCGLSVFDADLRLVAHNSQFRELLKLPDELFIAPLTKFESIIRHNAQRGEYGADATEDTVREIVERARTPVFHEFQRTRPDGVTLEIRGAPMPTGGFVTTYVDVSAAKRAEAALRTSEERQKRALEASRLALWDFDVESGRLYLSENWSEMLGGPSRPTATTFAALTQLVPQEDHARVQAALTGAFKGEVERYEVEHRVSRLDGTIIWIQSKGRVTHRDGEGQALHATGTNQDITARKNAEAEIRRAKEAAEAASQAKTDFLATISHEIRTPLNGVVGITELLLGEGLTPRQRRYAELVDASAHSLLTLINDLLDMGKIEAGRVALEQIPFSLEDLLAEVADLYTLRASEKSLLFRKAVAPGVPAWLSGDPHRLRQILSNLLTNALKFTATGEVGLSVELQERQGDRATLRFVVRDTGIGIPAEVQARLFHRFEQADQSTTRKYGGTGLGLAIVKHLSELMGGRVWLDSEPGRGSHFTCEIPFQVAPAGEARQGRSPSTRAQREPRPQKLLVAEDNATNQIVIQGLLAQLGFEHVVTTHNGQEAVDASGTGAFDLVLMDCHMPVMDGFAATRALRAAGYTRPIIAMTASATAADRETCLAAGMDDYLSKPLDSARIDQVLSRWLDGPQAPAAAEPSVPAVPVFEREAAVARLGGSEELFHMVLSAFLAQTPDVLAAAHSAAVSVQPEELRRHLHSLGGSSASVGASAFSAQARVLEGLAAEGDAAGAAASLPLLARMFDSFKAAAQQDLPS